MRHGIHQQHLRIANGLRHQGSPSNVRSHGAPVVVRAFAIPVVRELPRRTDDVQFDASTW